LILSCLAAFAVTGSLYAADISASLDGDRVGPGETATLSVKVSGADNVAPVSIPKTQGLSITFAGMAQSYEWVNGKSWQGKTLSFSITPSGEGTFTVPPLDIRVDGKVLQTQSLKLVSSKKYSTGGVRNFGGFRIPRGMPNPFEDAGGEEDISLKTSLDIPKRAVYSGEPVIVRYLVTPGRDADVSLKGFETMPKFEGFIQKDFTAEKKRGRAVPVAGYVLIPQSAGKYTIGGENAVIGSNDFFSARRVSFEKADITARALPSEGKPSDFSGNVGSFEIASDLSPYSCAAFDEKRFAVTVRGTGNFLGIKRPEFVSPQESLKILYEDGTDSFGVESDTLKGEKTFNVTIIAEKEGVFSTGDLVMNYFDPSSSSYKTKKIPGVSITVSGKKAADKSGTTADEGHGYAVFVWIFGAVLLVLAVIVFVIVHDRRKYLAPAADAADEKEVSLPEVEKAEKLSLDAIIAISDDAAFMREAEKYLSEAEDSGEIRSLREHCMRVKYGGGSSGADLIREGLRKLRDA
jgi:hypothetical protein